MEEYEKKKALEEINKTREELDKREQKIFYFENEAQWQLAAEEARQKKEVHNALMAKQMKKVEAEYISPEAIKRNK